MGSKRRRLNEGTAERIDTAESERAHLDPQTIESTEKEIQSGRSLFVRSLSATTTSDGLVEFFSRAYPIKHATVVLDRATGTSKGFGFVTFTDVQDAKEAQTTLNGSKLNGRPVRLEFAESRHRGESGKGSTSTPRTIREPKVRERPSLPKLIVRNLPWTIKSEEQLKDMFQKYGKIRHVNFPKRKDGLSPGFGFVVFLKKASAERAIAAVNGIESHGRSLAVDWAVDKQIWESSQIAQAASAEEADQPPQSNTAEIAESAESETLSEIGEASPGEDSTQVDVEQVGSRASSGKDLSSTIFVRNVPFDATDGAISNHFSAFGRLQSARVVRDTTSKQSKGTAFVTFRDPESVDACLREARMIGGTNVELEQGHKSILEDASKDPQGHFTLDGRIMRVFRAVAKSEAIRLSEQSQGTINGSNVDRRRLYLLNEGTIPADGPLRASISAADVAIRERSLSQRRLLLTKDPTLVLSLTRLSVRNLPKAFSAKDLKALARRAVLEFARDVKAGVRMPLSKEENARGGNDMRLAEKERKSRGKGIVKQAKIILESRDGSKVSEKSGVGRSRGYGFIEYTSHRWALMGLRWLNGHLAQPPDATSGTLSDSPVSRDLISKKRLVVEFAIENAQVLARRQQREGAKDYHPKTRQIGRAEGKAENPKNAIVENRPRKDTSHGDGSGPTIGVVSRARASHDLQKHSLIGRKRMARKARRKA